MKDSIARPILLLVFALAFSSMGSTYCSFSSGHHHHGDCHDHGSTRHCGHHPGTVHHTGVVVLITDRPAEDLRSLFVTITEVAFLGADVGPQVVYSSDEGFRVDLLSLRGSARSRLYEVLVGETPLPSGVYVGISLHVEDPTIVLTSGEVVDSTQVDLVARGRIEIGLAPTALGPDDLTYLALDFDVRRSVAVSRDDGRWTIRPLVIAQALGGEVREEISTPTDASGVISTVSVRDRTLALELTDRRGSVEVKLSDSTIVLAADMTRAGFDALAAGSSATVRGRWNSAGQLEAHAVTLGRVVRLFGVITEARQPTDSQGRAGENPGSAVLLSVELFPGQGFAGAIAVLASEATLLSVDRIADAALTDLVEGTRVVVAIPPPDAGSPGLVPENGIAARASRIDLRREFQSDDGGGMERVAGVVAAIDPEGRGLLVATDGVWRRVVVSRDAAIVRLEKGPEYLTEDLLLFEDLREGMRVETETSFGGAVSRFVIATPGNYR